MYRFSYQLFFLCKNSSPSSHLLSYSPHSAASHPSSSSHSGSDRSASQRHSRIHFMVTTSGISDYSDSYVSSSDSSGIFALRGSVPSTAWSERNKKSSILYWSHSSLESPDICFSSMWWYTISEYGRGYGARISEKRRVSSLEKYFSQSLTTQ